MSSDTSENPGPYNYWRPFLAIINFGGLLWYGVSQMRATADLWDYIFVGAGCYLTLKFIRYLVKAHRFKETRIRPSGMTEFPNKGIYAKIRQPISAAIIYMNLAYVCFYRSLAMIPIVSVFIAFWYILARYEDQLMLSKFGEEYMEYMKGTAMLRGGSDEQQRLASSGYDMY
jgi:protein-S-isoprenylcysteine O-methyltransferase Ste14